MDKTSSICFPFTHSVAETCETHNQLVNPCSKIEVQKPTHNSKINYNDKSNANSFSIDLLIKIIKRILMKNKSGIIKT